MGFRYEIEHAVQEAITATVEISNVPTSRILYSVTDVAVNATVLDLSGNTLTLFAGETGSTTIANPTTANALSGVIEAWVEAPDYDINVSGTGVTSYTQKVRMSQQGVFNVKSYGAKSDGATNDLTKVQAAYTAAATAGVGNTVYFPNTGTYVVTGTLTTPNNNAVYLDGGGLDTIAAVARPDLASGTTIYLPPNSGMVNLTGTTTIETIGIWPAGKIVTLYTATAITLKDGVGNIQLPGSGVDFNMTSGDTITLRSSGGVWREIGRSG